MIELGLYYFSGTAMAVGFVCLAEFVGSLFTGNPKPVLLVVAVVAAIVSTKTVHSFSKGARK